MKISVQNLIKDAVICMGLHPYKRGDYLKYNFSDTTLKDWSGKDIDDFLLDYNGFCSDKFIIGFNVQDSCGDLITYGFCLYDRDISIVGLRLLKKLLDKVSKYSVLYTSSINNTINSKLHNFLGWQVASKKGDRLIWVWK